MSFYGGPLNLPSFGANPFTGKKFSPLQRIAFEDDPQNAINYYLAANPLSGRRAVSGSFRSFLQTRLPELFKDYTAGAIDQPNLTFADFLATYDPKADYLNSNPFLTSASIFGRPTRLLRR